MSYENPQRQVISNAPAFQNLQNTISSTVKDVGETLGKLWYEKQKEKAANKKKELNEMFTKQTSAMQKLTDAAIEAEAKSDIPINLQVMTNEGKSIVFDQTANIKPGTDPKIIANAQKVIGNVNAFPSKTVELAAWFKSDIDKMRKAMQENNLSSLMDDENFADLKALVSASSGNPNAIRYRMEKDENWNPIIIGEVLDEKGNVTETGKFEYGKMKNAFGQGGLVATVPDPASILEGTKKKANSIFEVKTTTGKDGKTISETDGRILPQFLDLANAKPDPNTKTTVESLDGKTLLEKGIVVATVNKKQIADNPNFNAAVDSEASGMLTNIRDAYSFNNDVMSKTLGDAAKLPKPSEITDRQAWEAKFKENFKAYTLENIPPTQPIKNEAGEFVTETLKAEKPVKPPKGGGKPTMDMKIANRNYRIFTGQNKHEPVVDPLNKKIQYAYSADGKFRKQEYMSGVSGAPGMWVDAPDGPGNTYTNIKEFYNEHSDWFQKPALPTKK
jgi:hypothetical protein